MENNDLPIEYLLTFLEQNKIKEISYNANEPIETQLFLLFRNDERIAAFANGIGYYYVLLDNNKLLVITYDFDHGLPTTFNFKLIDNANSMMVKTVKTHEKGVNFIQISGDKVIEEMIYSPELSELDINRPLKELIDSVSIEELKERIKKKGK